MLNKVNITGEFWRRYQSMFCSKVLDKQWRILNGEVRVDGVGYSHCIDNFRAMAGDTNERFNSYWFSDHELGRWMEAAAYGVVHGCEPHIVENLEYAIDLLERAQCEDGYLNTWYTLYEPGKRWTNFTSGHELFNAGSFIEAGVAYYRTSGKRRLLDIAIRYADLIYDKVFETDIYIYDGHPAIEIALIKLYLVTQESKYLKLAKRMVDTRGSGRCLFLDEDSPRPPEVGLEYFQSHLPVRDQHIAVGHAVRAVYLYTAMAELVRLAEDESLLEPVRTLWKDIVDRKIYITGGIGSEHHGERFTIPYDLPNDTAYSETCAGIGLIMFAHALLKIQPESSVADVMEKVLYNVILSGVSVDGNAYFYVNPLSVKPDTVQFRRDLSQARTQREEWMLCPCCPPNLMRFILSLEEYIYTFDDDAIYINLLVSNEASFDWHGQNQSLSIKGNEPWDGRFTITAGSNFSRTLCLKIPYWSEGYTLKKNGMPYTPDERAGYVQIDTLQQGDVLELSFVMSPHFVFSNPQVAANGGKIAVERGYVVYCAEQVDNGANLHSVLIDLNSGINSVVSKEHGNLPILTVSGKKPQEIDQLYTFASPKYLHTPITLVPYYYWGNRGEGEMSVWMNAAR